MTRWPIMMFYNKINISCNVPVWPIKEPAGECPTGTEGPGEEMGMGLGTCRGLEGECASGEG